MARSHSSRSTSHTVFACAWILLLVVLSFLPAHFKEHLHTKGRLHLWDHLLAFGVGAMLIANATRKASVRNRLLFGSLLLAFGLELSQHFVYGTPLEWRDVLMDALGLSLCPLLVLLRHEPRQAIDRYPR